MASAALPNLSYLRKHAYPDLRISPSLPRRQQARSFHLYPLMAVRLVSSKAGAVTIEITGHLHEDEYLIINPVESGPFVGLSHRYFFQLTNISLQVLIVKPNFDLDTPDCTTELSCVQSDGSDDSWLFKCIGQRFATSHSISSLLLTSRQSMEVLV